MWQQQSALAMQSFCQGDNSAAIKQWKDSISTASRNRVNPTVELAEVHYCLGKCLSDERKDDEALAYLERAVEIFEGQAPNHSRLSVARYELANVLKRLGADLMAAGQFQAALNIAPPTDSFIPLRLAVDELQGCGIAKELDHDLLAKICRKLRINPNGDNADIAQVLLAYYRDPLRGANRIVADNFFVSDYVNFDPIEVLERLGRMIGEPGFLTIEAAEEHPANGTWMTITFRRIDSRVFVKTCASVVGIVDLFSEQLEACGYPSRFYSLEFDSCFVAYLLGGQRQVYLQKAKVLSFD